MPTEFKTSSLAGFTVGASNSAAAAATHPLKDIFNCDEFLAHKSVINKHHNNEDLINLLKNHDACYFDEQGEINGRTDTKFNSRVTMWVLNIGELTSTDCFSSRAGQGLNTRKIICPNGWKVVSCISDKYIVCEVGIQGKKPKYKLSVLGAAGAIESTDWGDSLRDLYNTLTGVNPKFNRMHEISGLKSRTVQERIIKYFNEHYYAQNKLNHDIRVAFYEHYKLNEVPQSPAWRAAFPTATPYSPENSAARQEIISELFDYKNHPKIVLFRSQANTIIDNSERVLQANLAQSAAIIASSSGFANLLDLASQIETRTTVAASAQAGIPLNTVGSLENNSLKKARLSYL